MHLLQLRCELVSVVPCTKRSLWRILYRVYRWLLCVSLSTHQTRWFVLKRRHKQSHNIALFIPPHLAGVHTTHCKTLRVFNIKCKYRFCLILLCTATENSWRKPIFFSLEHKTMRDICIYEWFSSFRNKTGWINKNCTRTFKNVFVCLTRGSTLQFNDNLRRRGHPMLSEFWTWRFIPHYNYK